MQITTRSLIDFMCTYIFKILTPSLQWSSALSAIIKTSITLYLTETWLEKALDILKLVS